LAERVYIGKKLKQVFERMKGYDTLLPYIICFGPWD
jgi:hypothetical protein